MNTENLDKIDNDKKVIIKKSRRKKEPKQVRKTKPKKEFVILVEYDVVLEF